MASRNDNLLRRRGLLPQSSVSAHQTGATVINEEDALRMLNSGSFEDLQNLRIAFTRNDVSLEMFQRKSELLFKLISHLSNINRSDVLFQAILLLGCLAERAKGQTSIRQKFAKHAGAYLHSFLYSYSACEINFQLGLSTVIGNLADNCPAAVGILRLQHLHLGLVELLSDRLVIDDDNMDVHTCSSSALRKMCEVSVKTVDDILEEKHWRKIFVYSQNIFSRVKKNDETLELVEELLHLLTLILSRKQGGKNEEIPSLLRTILLWLRGIRVSEIAFIHLVGLLHVCWERHQCVQCEIEDSIWITKTAVSQAMAAKSHHTKTLAFCLLGDMCSRWPTEMGKSVFREISYLQAFVSSVANVPSETQLHGCRFVCSMLACTDIDIETLDACVSIVWAVVGSLAIGASKTDDERIGAAVCILLICDKFHHSLLQQIVEKKAYLRSVLKTTFEKIHSDYFDLSSLSWIVQ